LDSKPVKRGRDRTRAAVIEAAARLFLAHGYVATTVESVAVEAGVAVQTLYNVFGSKRDVLQAVVEATLAEGEVGRPPRESVRERAAAATSGRELIRYAVEFWVAVRPRSEPMFEVVRQAAAVDPEIGALQREQDLEKLRSMTVAAGDLARRGWLRSDLGVDEAAAVLWTLSHPQSYRLFVDESGWEVGRYSEWLEDALCAALLDDPG
jgi:AcrR family transcriptional regulator